MTPPIDDFADLLSRARAGSRETLGQILDACRAYLMVVARANLDAVLQAKAGASDLVQETFLEAQRDFAQFRGESADELRAWMRQLLLNNLANFTRSFRDAAKRDVDREIRTDRNGSDFDLTVRLSADALSPSGMALAREQVDKLLDALARLPFDYRQVLMLRYQGGYGFEEIAAELGRSVNAVRKLWARAVERLRREMGEPP